MTILRKLPKIILYAILLGLSYLASFTLAFEITEIYAVGSKNVNFNDWQDYWRWNWQASGELASLCSILSYILFVPVAAAVLFLTRRIEKRLSTRRSDGAKP